MLKQVFIQKEGYDSELLLFDNVKCTRQNQITSQTVCFLLVGVDSWLLLHAIFHSCCILSRLCVRDLQSCHRAGTQALLAAQKPTFHVIPRWRPIRGRYLAMRLSAQRSVAELALSSNLHFSFDVFKYDDVIRTCLPASEIASCTSSLWRKAALLSQISFNLRADSWDCRLECSGLWTRPRGPQPVALDKWKLITRRVIECIERCRRGHGGDGAAERVWNGNAVS